MQWLLMFTIFTHVNSGQNTSTTFERLASKSDCVRAGEAHRASVTPHFSDRSTRQVAAVFTCVEVERLK